MNKKIKMPVGTIALKEGEFVNLEGDWQAFPPFDEDPKTQYCLMCESYAKELESLRINKSMNPDISREYKHMCERVSELHKENFDPGLCQLELLP